MAWQYFLKSICRVIEFFQILTWLNPCVNVSANGVYVKAFGLKSSVLEQSPHFSHLVSGRQTR